MNLKGKSAIVTGGASGIGAAIALKLAGYGASVAIIDLNIKAAEKVSGRIEEMGCIGLAVQADISDFEEAGRVAGHVVDTLGSLDMLVNNAGINRDGVVWKMTEEQWDDVLRINLKGYFNYTRHAAAIFRGQKSGKIVNVTSINGLRGKFGQTNYSASKAGVIGLTKATARELGKYGVNVNAIAPGLIMTEMMKQAPQSVLDKALEEIVIGRIGRPEDVAEVAAFLCSGLSRHITGEVIKVDGGQYI